METLSLLFIHVAVGIFWAGGAIALGLFVIPSVLDAGPAGGAVMAGIVKRRLPTVLTIAGSLVVLTGLRLYMLRFSVDWLTSPEGLVLTVGALSGLEAFAIGVLIQRPTAEKLGALGRTIAAAGVPPTPAQAGEIKTLQQKLRKAALMTTISLIIASVLMASHRLVTVM